jgi:hypothetical protein
MKRAFLVFSLTVAATLSVPADTLTQWNFNSNPPDPTNNPTTGTLEPSVGTGTATLVGGATSTFAGGSTVDPAAVDDSGWNTATYPAQGTGNKTRGVQFRASTLGFESIVVTWEQQNSATSSRYTRFQHSVDGSNFVDGAVIVASTAGQYGSQSVNLNSIPALNDNPNFAFRILAEFESTATGAGTVGYVATTGTSAYATGGTIRYDYVTISGVPATGNNFPTISAITNRTIRANEALLDVPFTVGDVETPADQLLLSGTSSNQGLVPDAAITFGGAGADRTVSITPTFFQSGTAIITLTVTDDGGKMNSTSFTLTVLPDNTAPTLTASFTNYHALVNTALPAIPFTIGDLETTPDGLDVSATSSNPTLIPEAGLELGGAGASRTITVIPAAGQTGNAVVTITVDDLQLRVSRSFHVMVLPSANLLLCEPFDYPDGPVTTNSAGLWSNHSGTFGQANVAAGVLQVTDGESEDINARLIGSPYSTNSGAVLYASMKVTFTALPGEEYFAHYREVGGSFRARIFGTVSNVTAGAFRLGIANTLPASGGTLLERDLSLNTTYLVVSRYHVGSGVSTLWLNPSSESDPGVTATDPVDPDPIGSFAFRQSNANGGIGDLTVDDLKIGLSFVDVVPGAFEARLTITRTAIGVQVSWPAAATDAGYAIQSSTTLGPSADWQPPGPAPVREGSRDVLTLNGPLGNAFFRLRQ